jgi:hypothetical protein
MLEVRKMATRDTGRENVTTAAVLKRFKQQPIFCSTYTQPGPARHRIEVLTSADKFKKNLHLRGEAFFDSRPVVYPLHPNGCRRQVRQDEEAGA